MKIINAYKLYNGDEIIIKRTKEIGIVKETAFNSNLFKGEHVAVCVCIGSKIDWYSHKQLN
jgi:hypothetical protein